MNHFENMNHLKKEIVEYPLDDHLLRNLNLPELPSGYCYIGGAARSAAFALIRKGVGTLPIRDLDIGMLPGADESQRETLSEKYMPEDYAHGYGVAEIEDIEDYMNSRDFTMIKDRLMIKAELMKAVMQESGLEMTMDPNAQRRISRNWFQLALCMQKSFEYGNDIPEHFVNNLRGDRVFDEEVLHGRPTDVAQNASNFLEGDGGYKFEYRGEAAKIIAEVSAMDAYYDQGDDVLWLDECERIIEASRLSGKSAKYAGDDF